MFRICPVSNSDRKDALPTSGSTEFFFQIHDLSHRGKSLNTTLVQSRLDYLDFYGGSTYLQTFMSG